LDAALHTAKPVVYVYLGDGTSLEAHEADALLKGLTSKHFHVLWSLPKNNRHLLPENLPMSVRWNSHVPQLAVLAHSAVQLVLAQGALPTVQEALLFSKPLLLLPAFVEQREIAQRVAAFGAATIIHRSMLSTNSVAEAVTEMLSNNSYAQRATHMGATLLGSGGTREAATLVELVYRIGASFLLTHDHKLPWHQQWLPVDVYAIYCTVLATLALLIRQCWAGISALWSDKRWQ